MKTTSELPCGENMEYEVCGPAYQNTCWDILASNTAVISAICHEGCFCEEGLVMDGNKCVNQTQCGCIYDGVYYSVSVKCHEKMCKTPDQCVL